MYRGIHTSQTPGCNCRVCGCHGDSMCQSVGCQDNTYVLVSGLHGLPSRAAMQPTYQDATLNSQSQTDRVTSCNLVSFPDPNNPSVDHLQYHSQGRRTPQVILQAIRTGVVWVWERDYLQPHSLHSFLCIPGILCPVNDRLSLRSVTTSMPRMTYCCTGQVKTRWSLSG